MARGGSPLYEQVLWEHQNIADDGFVQHPTRKACSRAHSRASRPQPGLVFRVARGNPCKYLCCVQTDGDTQYFVNAACPGLPLDVARTFERARCSATYGVRSSPYSVTNRGSRVVGFSSANEYWDSHLTRYFFEAQLSPKERKGGKVLCVVWAAAARGPIAQGTNRGTAGGDRAITPSRGPCSPIRSSARRRHEYYFQWKNAFS